MSERRVPVIPSVQLHQVGITPLFLAVRGGHSQIVQFLCGSPSSRWNSSGAKTKSEAIMIHLYIYIYISSTLLAKLTIVTFGEAFVPPHIVFYTID